MVKAKALPVSLLPPSLTILNVTCISLLQLAAELHIMVVILATSNSPPSILPPTPHLPHDVVYTSPNASTSINLTCHDPDTAMAMTFAHLLGPSLPSWVVIGRPTLTGVRVCEVTVLLEPTKGQLGSNILCFEAADHLQAKSAPACVVVVVVMAFVEVSSCNIYTEKNSYEYLVFCSFAVFIATIVRRSLANPLHKRSRPICVHH